MISMYVDVIRRGKVIEYLLSSNRFLTVQFSQEIVCKVKKMVNKYSTHSIVWYLEYHDDREQSQM